MSLGKTDMIDALTQISGVPVTAYDSDGEVDLATSGRIARRIGEAGVRNVIAAGNTGEFFSLSIDEIRRLTASTIEAVADAAMVTAAVGRSLREARALGDAAVSDGASALMAHYPADPFAGPAQKIDYFLALADHAKVPLVAYLRSDEAPVADLVRLAEHDNVVAVKFATGNLMRLGEVIRASRHCDTIWVCGLAEGWAPPFYAMGARGFTSGLVNIFPEISLSIHAALEAGDYTKARAEIDEIAEFEKLRTLSNNGANVTVVKEALRLTGVAVGEARLPGVPHLPDDAHRTLREIVERLTPRLAAQ